MAPGFWIFIGSVVLYSTLPILSALRPGRLRFILFYAYIAVLLVMGGLLGSIYVLPVAGDIEIPAGQVTYGGFMFATIVATIVGREVRVIRNVIVLLIAMNAVVYVLFALSSRAMNTTGVINPFGTSPDVFDQQLRTVVSGGVLSIIELLVLFQALEAAKRRVPSEWMTPVYVGGFIGVLLLDGALFGPLVNFPDTAGMASMIWDGVQAKALLASAFSVPLIVFLVAFRPTIRRYEQATLEWPVQLFSSDSHLRSTTGWRPRSPTGRRRNDELSVDVGRALAHLDATRSVEVVLAELGTILARLPGVRSAPTMLAVRVEDDVTSRFGPVSTGPTSADAPLPARTLDEEIWCDPIRLQVDPIAHVPIVVDESTVGLLDVRLERGHHEEGQEQLRAVAMHVTSLLAPCLREICDQWTIRAPIIDIIEHRALDVVFQPIVDLATGRVVSVEALSRFHDGTAPANRFAEAERAGLAAELELLAFDEALRAAAVLPDDLRVAINLSPAVALDHRLDRLLANVHRPITFEITEHHLVEDYRLLRERIDHHGDVRLAIDDAGSGYATLTHVLEMTPDFIKLDRAWVTGIQHDRPRQVLVSGLKALADEIDAEVIAEGIELSGEIATLENLGIRLGQGFLLGQPVAGVDFSYA